MNNPQLPVHYPQFQDERKAIDHRIKVLLNKLMAHKRAEEAFDKKFESFALEASLLAHDSKVLKARRIAALPWFHRVLFFLRLEGLWEL